MFLFHTIRAVTVDNDRSWLISAVGGLLKDTGMPKSCPLITPSPPPVPKEICMLTTVRNYTGRPEFSKW
jgi:hypothetical protein